MSRMNKAKWAQRVMRSRYFVVLTDKESALYVEGADPSSFDDIIALQAQGAALAAFHSKLEALIKAHEKAVQKLLDVKPKRSKRVKAPTTNRNAKVKKIRVKEG